MLPEQLGNEFYTHKKYPAPIKIHGMTKDELKDQLNKSASAT
jgi:hypothetical protein